jgi:hypothetical protein
MNKTFTISLDCELNWAEPNPPDKRWDVLRSDPSAGREIYKKLLELFQKHNIPATWAFVGHLFYDECTSGQHYEDRYIERHDPHGNVQDNPLYYAPDLIEMVNNSTIDHEIGGHSFAHKPYTEMSKNEAYQDLKSLHKASKSAGYNLDSFVFPQNKIQHENILKEFDFKIYRGESLHNGPYTFKQGIPALIKSPRQFLSIPLVNLTTESGGIIQFNSSNALRSERWWFLQHIRIKRALESMKPNQSVHITAHPHDFLYIKYLIYILDSILSAVADLRDQNKLQVKTMNDYK